MVNFPYIEFFTASYFILKKITYIKVSKMSDIVLNPQVISRILTEIRDLNRKPAEGIKFIDNEENSVTEVHAIISGPEGTPFHRGKFRMKLCLSADYPASPPRGYFLTKIYHPNVSSNGDICVNTLKKDWSPETSLKHVLQVIRCLLIVPFPESSLNDEAGKLFMDSYDEFARRAKLMTEVHAIDETDENEEEVDDENENEKTIAATIVKVTNVSKVSATGTDENVEANNSEVITTVFSSTDNAALKQKVKKASTSNDKDKDKKKKSLKRL